MAEHVRVTMQQHVEAAGEAVAEIQVDATTQPVWLMIVGRAFSNHCQWQRQTNVTKNSTTPLGRDEGA